MAVASLEVERLAIGTCEPPRREAAGERSWRGGHRLSLKSSVKYSSFRNMCIDVISMSFAEKLAIHLKITIELHT